MAYYSIAERVMRKIRCMTFGFFCKSPKVEIELYKLYNYFEQLLGDTSMSYLRLKN